MTVQQQRPSRKTRVSAEYGMGGGFSALFSRNDLKGKTALDVLRALVDSPHSPGSETRTARVVGEALSTLREIDVELIRSGGKAEGEPIALDQVIVEDDGEGIEENSVGQQQEEIRIRLSESYRGGVAR